MIAKFLKQLLEGFFNCHIYRNSMPRGGDFLFDLNRDFGLDSFKCTFDVGANIGETAIEYAARLTNANIYSFEPVPSSFEQLRQKVSHIPRLKLFNIALGSMDGESTINVHPYSQGSSIRTHRPEDVPTKITVRTLASVCGEEGIDHIHLLKIDTEGYEREVLEGAAPMLQNHRIDIVLLEVSDRDDDQYFTPFSVANQYLRGRGYELYGFYNQQHYWDGRKALLYFNAAWVSRSRLERNDSGPSIRR